MSKAKCGQLFDKGTGNPPPMGRYAGEKKVRDYAASDLKHPALARAAADAVYDGHIRRTRRSSCRTPATAPPTSPRPSAFPTHGQFVKRNPRLALHASADAASRDRPDRSRMPPARDPQPRRRRGAQARRPSAAFQSGEAARGYATARRRGSAQGSDVQAPVHGARAAPDAGAGVEADRHAAALRARAARRLRLPRQSRRPPSGQATRPSAEAAGQVLPGAHAGAAPQGARRDRRQAGCQPVAR